MNKDTIPKSSKKDKLLQRFLSGERLTVRTIQQQMWINSPTKMISDLRAEGHRIQDITIKTKNSRYKEYFITAKEGKS